MLNKLTPETANRRSWNAPTLKAVGTVGEILLGGGGKTSVHPADPGETRKPSSGGGE
jgi:hypothetical protein